ncbi:hypothetical protein AB6D68_06235 [Vibrio cyclitrophicus]
MLANVISLFVNISIGIFLVPYFISNVGIGVYAIIPLSMLFVEYVGLIGQSICTAINRQFTIAIKDDSNRNKIFNTALFGMIIICIIQIVIFIYPIYTIDSYIDIGDANNSDVFLLFLCVFVAFVVSLITSVFSVPLYSNNRLDIIQYGNVLRVASRAISVVLLFNLTNVSLSLVGYATLLGSCLNFIYIFFNFRKYANGLVLSLRYFDPKEFKNMSSIGGWLIVNQVGFLLLSRFDIFLANKLAGTRVSSDYAIIIQVSNLIRSCIGVFAGLMGPSMLLLYAQNKHDFLKDVTLLFMRFLSIVSVIPVVIFICFNEILLNYWLGSGYEYLNILSYILIVPLFVNTTVLPLFTINTAFNKVKIPGQMSIAFGIIYVLMSIYMYKYTGLGQYSIAVSSMLAITLKNAFFTPIYTALIMKENVFYFLKVHLYGFLYFFCSMFFVFSIRDTLVNAFGDIWGLFISIILLLIMITLISISTLSNNDRSIIRRVFRKEL